ncbi:ANTAR domain-containing protein [Streptomyces sp. NPDC005574]|uniref:ANTAR domain-containing protein n=1 Tax=Streptomyces sp. NPDC005574 TaxID=3156891 RepID=UPI0033BE4B81
MTETHRETLPPPSHRADGLAQELQRLREENRQLRLALTSHTVIDRATGVLTVLGQINPDDGFTVLREVSQRTNVKLIHIAEQLLKHAQGAALPDDLLTELRAALARHTTG